MSKAVAAGVVLLLAGVAGLFFWRQKVQETQAQRRAYLQQQQDGVVKQQFIKALPAVDIADWRGRPPEALARRFFGDDARVRNCCKQAAWSDCGVSNWKGWKEVALSFAEGGLRDATFTPPAPLSEAECVQIVTQKFGLKLPRGKYAVTEDGHGYEGLDGDVYSVQFVDVQARQRGRATLLFLASAAQSKKPFVPGDIRITFNWYVEGTPDRRQYAPPTPWP